jgi:hypothetical protein
MSSRQTTSGPLRDDRPSRDRGPGNADGPAARSHIAFGYMGGYPAGNLLTGSRRAGRHLMAVYCLLLSVT